MYNKIHIYNKNIKAVQLQKATQLHQNIVHIIQLLLDLCYYDLKLSKLVLFKALASIISDQQCETIGQYLCF